MVPLRSVLSVGLFSQTLLNPPNGAHKILLTNDDGWAVAQIRAEYNALNAAGYDVVLSAPAENSSGSGSLSVPATPVTYGCEFGSCPEGAPAYGFNASDRNKGIQVFGSGTVGAACEAAKEGIPSIAFSGSSSSTAHEGWTALYNIPPSSSILAAQAYSFATATFLSSFFSQPSSSPLLPPGVTINVNFPTLTDECTASDIQWVFTRSLPSIFSNDVVVCDNGGKLPTEGDVIAAGCFASVTVLDADTKLTVGKELQADVFARLSGLGFVCLP
ncbi:hypothetical protein PHLCEN_2v2589 [Hermanssonia centrifuga]|uniref:Survival protein SurE-like phosphatase/nucleotidase domain-containing protein n=1 Tax=Hermanssonia centrifuga TaxID=98765 RepID=A0A2R6RLG6_9APHY|nr:hypothetical protein PHLCEN_2v2589 [Hermanssonia centrifuga]